MPNRTRSQLKPFFVKNAIPSEANFADLIDSPLNQAEDGVYKTSGEPLAVVAAPGPQKKVLRLHADASAPAPDWVLCLTPTQDPNTPSSARPGLGVSNAAGVPRLFLDLATGNVGLGTTNPGTNRLQVEGNTRVNGTLTVSGDTALATMSASGLISANGGLTIKGDAVVNGSLTVNGAFTAPGASGLKLNGDTSVDGVLTARGFQSANSVVLNDYTTVNPASNVLLLSPPNDRDGWIYRDRADATTNSGIYHHQLDAPVRGLPGNSLGFIGGSALKAYINMVSGAAHFAGNVGLGTLDPGSNRLQVEGAARINGDLTVTGAAAVTALTVAGAASLNALTVTTNAAIKGGLTVGGGVTVAGKLSAADLSLVGWLEVGSNMSVGSALTVTTNATIKGDLAVANVATVKTLAVTGDATVNALTVATNVTVSAGLTVVGATTVAALTASGPAIANKGLTVSGMLLAEVITTGTVTIGQKQPSLTFPNETINSAGSGLRLAVAGQERLALAGDGTLTLKFVGGRMQFNPDGSITKHRVDGSLLATVIQGGW